MSWGVNDGLNKSRAKTLFMIKSLNLELETAYVGLYINVCTGCLVRVYIVIPFSDTCHKSESIYIDNIRHLGENVT